MIAPPDYFDEIRSQATTQWELIEGNRELYGVYNLLFNQLRQSPRHVLSELLQNADDAGATEARVALTDRYFIFEHNGEDFTRENFSSLCRFGYSNKRTLHTIGFRGIGFKSTFSIGDCVEVFTPSLAVSFNSVRFTEPQWLLDHPATNGTTHVRVAISDWSRREALEKNLQEWVSNPISLLFFQNLRRLRIGEEDLHWCHIDDGPIPDSAWMSFNDTTQEPLLLIRSDEQHFPEDALAEIKQERMLKDDEAVDFPDCRLEILMGTEGRLFVVLPTHVKTDLPFACNAPFIQDPARTSIKDPATSSTNRWLLERAGHLAASAMETWLCHPDLSEKIRAEAYNLFPDIDRDDSGITGSCEAIVKKSFMETIKGKELLLTHTGDLVAENQSIVMPHALFDVWSPEQVSELLDEEKRSPLSPYVTQENSNKLVHWELVGQIEMPRVLARLRAHNPPKPATWRGLLNLWTYVAPEITGYFVSDTAKTIRIVPVQGQEILYAASETVRLGEARLLQSNEDWEFLSPYLMAVNQRWLRFLADQKRIAETEDNPSLQQKVNAAYTVLEKMGLDGTSRAEDVMNRAAELFFSRDAITIVNAVRFTQIAAKLRIKAGASFRFFSREGTFFPSEQNHLFDEDGTLEHLLPENDRDLSLLHLGYSSYSSCTKDEWLQWVFSGRSGLGTFVPMISLYKRFWSKSDFDGELSRRRFIGNVVSCYSNPYFRMNDWDFHPEQWRHWETLAEEDFSIWVEVVRRMLIDNEKDSKAKAVVELHEIARNGWERKARHDGIPSSWILRLQELPCLPDTRGIPRCPEDLFRRTASTEALMEVENFIDRSLDTEKTAPLLDILGVQSEPTGPERLLDRLRALAKATEPPLNEVDKWYRRLDSMADTCTTDTLSAIKEALKEESIIYTQDGSWLPGTAVAIHSDENDIPGVPVIRASVRDLALWGKIGIAEKPSVERIIQWLDSLPAERKLSSDDARRVSTIIARHPVRIWQECDHWLNLAGEWAPTSTLRYALTMQTLFSWNHLFEGIKKETADFRRLSKEVTDAHPFSELPALAEQVRERPESNFLRGRTETKGWLSTLSGLLKRVKLADEEKTSKVRETAARLEKTGWLPVDGKIRVVPYIDGTPAGETRQADVLWFEESLYVSNLPKARLAKYVPEEIMKAFPDDSDIKALLIYSFERSPRDIQDYLKENFDLEPERQKDPVQPREEAVTDGDGRREGPPGEPKTDNTGGEGDTNAEGEADPTEEPAPETPGQGKDSPTEDLRPRTPESPKPLPIIERYAMEEGFRKYNDGRFYHANGERIDRCPYERSCWERYSATGELVQYYYPINHCLDKGPLEIRAEIWNRIVTNPKIYSLILENAEGDPKVIPGHQLQTMKDNQEIELYPATYRIRYRHGRNL